MSGIFSSVYGSLYALWNQITYAVSNIRFFDIIDILVVAYLLYKAFVFLRETRSGQLVKGLVVLIVVYALAKWWQLAVLEWILSVLFNSAIIILAIVFQPELRRILERVGRAKFNVGKTTIAGDNDIFEAVENVGRAARLMSESRTGALIVFERETQLGEIINTGTVTDAKISVPAITNIFFPNSPLHDGAVIIREGRLYAAGCILPLTENNNISASYGTRHRAAIGMTENSDAVVLVVSEETGNISIALNGEIKTGYNAVTAVERLNRLLSVDSENEEKAVVTTFKKVFMNLSSGQNTKSSKSEVDDNENKD